MALVTIATLWNEDGAQFRIRSCDHPKHKIDEERAKWSDMNAQRMRLGQVPWTITETVEEAA